jgi:hypothetical protein
VGKKDGSLDGPPLFPPSFACGKTSALTAALRVKSSPLCQDPMAYRERQISNLLKSVRAVLLLLEEMNAFGPGITSLGNIYAKYIKTILIVFNILKYHRIHT